MGGREGRGENIPVVGNISLQYKRSRIDENESGENIKYRIKTIADEM